MKRRISDLIRCFETSHFRSAAWKIPQLTVVVTAATLASSADAQSSPGPHCTLLGSFIDLGPATLTYFVNDAKVKEAEEAESKTASSANTGASQDWTNGGVQGETCGDGGIVGALRCNVTEPMKQPNVLLTPNVPGPENDGPSFQTLERKIDPNAEPAEDGLVLLGANKEKSAPDSAGHSSVKALSDAKVKVTVPVRRLMKPGNPPAIYTVPAGPPSYDATGPVSPAASKRAQEAMKANLAALISAPPFKVEGPSLAQLMAGGSGYTMPIVSSGKDDVLITAPVSNGASLPKACIPLVLKSDKLDRATKLLRDKKMECGAVASNIKAREKANSQGGVVDILAQFFRQDERLERLKKRKDICNRELKAISRAHMQAKDEYDLEVDGLSEAQNDRRIAAIKADPKLLAAEEARRQNAAIDTAAAWVKQDEKIQKGMLTYEKNLKKYDDEIAALAAGDDPDKDEKIAQLQADRDQYLWAYDTWLQRMVAIKHNRWKDHNRAFEQNAKDGIGPTNDDELDERILSAGGDVDAVIRSRFPDQEFARRDPGKATSLSQAEKDARAASGSISREATLGELTAEVAQDVATMTPFERAENLYKYGPSAAKGSGEAIAEGLKGIYDLGKGAIDLNEELQGREGFEGSTKDKIARFGERIGDLGRRGTDDRLNERGYFENFNDNIEKLADTGGDQLERKFENMAGQGERGAKEATRLFAKGGTMIVGGEAVVIQGLARAGQAARGLGTLGKADDAARALDTAGDLARSGDGVVNPGRLSDAATDAASARRVLDDGSDVGTEAARLADDADLGTVSVNRAEQAAENAALREAYATEAPINPSQSRSIDPSKTTTDINGGNWRDMLPFGAPPKFTSKTPARQAQDALEAAGVDPNIARVFGARASARDADAAIAAGAFESGVNPARLYESGSISKDGLRNGLKNYFTEMGVPADRQAIAIDKYMNQPPPASAGAGATVTPPPRAPQSGGAQAAVPTQKLDTPVEAAASSPVRERGNAGRYSRAELDKRLAADAAGKPEPDLPPTQRFTPEDVAAAQAAPNRPRTDPSATQRLTPEELAGAEAPLRPTPTEALQGPATARMAPEGLPSPEAPTVRMTAAEKAAQQSAATKQAPTERFTPEDVAAAQSAPNRPRTDPSATQRLTPEELAGAEAPLRPTPTEALPSSQKPGAAISPSEPVAMQPRSAPDVPLAASGADEATQRLSSEQLADSLKGATKPAIVPTEPQPVRITPTPEGNLRFEHAGRQVEVPQDLEIGAGATSTVYGADGKPNVLKASRWDPQASHLDDLGRELMTGKVPIPELRKRFAIEPGSNLSPGVSVSGGRLSVLERGPEPFAKTADALENAGKGIGAERKAALKSFMEPLNKEGVVVTDLKADNLGFRPSTNPNNTNALEAVPLDDGVVIVLKPEYNHLAPEMQRILLDPGDVVRSMDPRHRLMELRARMADYDKYVDWAAMNGNLPDRPLRTLGGGKYGLPYTPNLGLRFSGLAD